MGIMNGEVDPNEIERQNGEAYKTLKANKGDVTTERYISHLVSKIKRNKTKPVELTTDERNKWAKILQVKINPTRQSPRIHENTRMKEVEKETKKWLSDDYNLNLNPFVDSTIIKTTKPIYIHSKDTKEQDNKNKTKQNKTKQNQTKLN